MSYRGFGEYPFTTGASATVTGLPEVSTTTGSSGVNFVAVAVKPHSYGRRPIWRCLLPWGWFGPPESLVDLIAWLLRGDWEYVHAVYLSRWANECCDEWCECDYAERVIG